MSVNKEILGKGWAFPFEFSPVNGGVASQDGLNLIKSSILQILGTVLTTRVFLRNFGSRMQSLVFEPNTSGILALIEHNVREAVRSWEPRVDVITLYVSGQNPKTSVVNVGITFKVIQTNVVGNLVYPLYLNPDQRSSIGKVTG